MKKLTITTILLLTLVGCSSAQLDAFYSATYAFRQTCVENTITVSMQPVEDKQAFVATCDRKK